MVSKFHCIGFTQRIFFVKLSFFFFKTSCQTVSQFRVGLGNSFCTWVSCRHQFLILKTYVGNSFQYAGSMQEKVSLCIWTLTQKHIKALQFANSFPNLGLFLQIASGLHRQRGQGTSQYICIYIYIYILILYCTFSFHGFLYASTKGWL